MGPFPPHVMVPVPYSIPLHGFFGSILPFCFLALGGGEGHAHHRGGRLQAELIEPRNTWPRRVFPNTLVWPYVPVAPGPFNGYLIAQYVHILSISVFFFQVPPSPTVSPGSVLVFGFTLECDFGLP